MTEGRGPHHPPCSLCGSTSHVALKDDGLLRCPERPLPAYVTSGLKEVARGICWAADPESGLHCTQAPHGPDVDHRNAYTGKPWPAREIPAS